MKFKAFVTDNGISLLEKRFLPALEKIGKTCHLYLTGDHAIFLHNLLNGDGIQSIPQFTKEALFGDYRITSQNDDRIAFAIDLSLLHSVVAIYAEFSGSGESSWSRTYLRIHGNQCHIYLTFELQVIQDVPISKPLSRADIQELQEALDAAQDLPELVQVPDIGQLQNFVERIKYVGDLLNVSVTKYGDLHLQISTTLITLGAEFRKLFVIGGAS